MSDRQGAVFDLGYVPYTGLRRGRMGAVQATIWDGIRRVLGIGRKARRKVLPWLLIGIALIPAIVFVGATFLVGNFTPEADSPFGGHVEYFGIVAGTALLFTALAAPELLVPDRREGVLSIYGSRPLTSVDYVSARFAALVAIVAAFLLVPQLLIYVGLAALDSGGFASTLVEDVVTIPRLLAASAAYILAFVPPAFLLASFINRVAAAAGIYLAAMFLINGIAEGLSQNLVTPGARYFALIALVDHARHVTDWIFGTASADVVPATAGFHPAVSLAVILAVAAVSSAAVLWRYRRLL